MYEDETRPLQATTRHHAKRARTGGTPAPLRALRAVAVVAALLVRAHHAMLLRPHLFRVALIPRSPMKAGARFTESTLVAVRRRPWCRSGAKQRGITIQRMAALTTRASSHRTTTAAAQRPLAALSLDTQRLRRAPSCRPPHPCGCVAQRLDAVLLLLRWQAPSSRRAILGHVRWALRSDSVGRPGLVQGRLCLLQLQDYFGL